MIVGSEKKDCAMNTISRTDLKCATVTVIKKYSQVYGILKKRRMELGYPIVTVEKQSQACAMHKKNRMELG